MSPSVPSARKATFRLPACVSAAAAGVALLGLLQAGTHLGVAWMGLLGMAELDVRNYFLGPGPSQPDPRIIIVGIDESSPSKLGLSRPVLPLPRTLHAELLDHLKQAGAREVVFDLLFTQPSVPAEDRKLAEAIERSAPTHVTLAADYDADRSGPDLRNPSDWRYWFRSPVVAPAAGSPNVTIASAVSFDPGGKVRGAILLRPDAATGKWIPHLALSALMGYYRTPAESALLADDTVSAGGYSWPVGPTGEELLAWKPRPIFFPQLEYADVLQGLRGNAQNGELFRDKIVLVGDLSGTDVHNTSGGRMNGTVFVAHTINSLLGPPIRELSIPLNLLWAFAITLPAAWGASRGWRRAVLVLPAVAIACLGVPALLLRFGDGHERIWLTSVGPLAAMILSLPAARFLGREELVRRFVPVHLQTRADSVTEEATVMFADLRGSTAMADRLGAVRAQELLTELLAHFSPVVTAYGGEVERTLGDGLMAVFRGNRGGLHALRAVRTACDLQRTALRLSSRWVDQYGQTAGITIGIESGTVSGGLIQAGEREEWSSFGPTVNLAARLQGACGPDGTAVLLGPMARRLLREIVPTELVGEFELRGISGKVTAYQLAESCVGSGEDLE